MYTPCALRSIYYTRNTGGHVMGLVKCPRCELNYMDSTEKLCKVCIRETSRRETVEEPEMCTICNEAPALPGKDMCLFCLKEFNEQAVSAVDAEDTDDSEDAVELDEIEQEPQDEEYGQLGKEFSLEEMEEQEDEDDLDEDEEN